jgi:adenosine deaminase
MRTLIATFTFFFCISLNAQTPKRAETPEARTAREMDQLKSDPLRLRNFLKAMPKGGDLHNHLSGAVYAESFLQWAAEEGDCIDTTALSIVKPANNKECGAGQVTAESALHNPGLYSNLLSAMSMYQYLPEKTHDTGHDHFFASFPKFGVVSENDWGKLLAEQKTRAEGQGEEYLELMMGLDRNVAGGFGEKVSWDETDLRANYDAILQSGVRELVPQMRGWLDEAEKQAQASLRCGAASAAPGCDVETRYIYQVYRAASREHVFAQMIAGFELASVDPRVVAINLVQPEDWYVSTHDYALHMSMLQLLHEKYPKVHITLHAGELAPGLVKPEDLSFHIRSAIRVGGAERIGHGVDVMYEDHPEQLLKEMADKHVAVEINLTSNRVILGVSSKMHPLRQYLRAGVPVVISTDDEGVSRSSMTDELMQAVLDQGMSYQELKQAERNSIRYSFLDDATKKRLSQCLEQRFTAFERNQKATLPVCSKD